MSRSPRGRGAKAPRSRSSRAPTTRALALHGVEFPVAVSRKQVRRVTLRVHPPDGDVRVSAPHGVSETEIRAFVQQHLAWIRRHRERIQALPRPAAPTFQPGEVHYLDGKPLGLEVRGGTHRVSVGLGMGTTLLLSAPGYANAEARARALERFYRAHLRAALPPLLARWEPRMGVRVAAWGVKRMKTRWGSCNPHARRIWLNLELAKRRPALLEYVVVHELAHLYVADHGPAFQALMTRFLPGWRTLRRELNAWPTWAMHPPDDDALRAAAARGEPDDALDQEPDG